MIEYKKDNIAEKIVKDVNKIIEDPDFSLEKIK